MIQGYFLVDGKLRPVDDVFAEPRGATWIDLLRPSPDEERDVEKAFGIEAPTREEMNEIEVSSRLYADGDSAFMTALVLSNADTDDPIISPVTFVVAPDRLLTIRYSEPRAFAAFCARYQKSAIGGAGAEAVCVGLLEAIVDRLADVLEKAGSDIEKLSLDIFATPPKGGAKPRDFQRILVELGRRGDLVSKIRDSLVTLERLASYFILFSDQRVRDRALTDKKADKDIKARLKTLSRDCFALSDQVSYLSQKITFLLDATLGMINIEQNAIIKFFSVVAVVFLPPTLIASMYGMNFEFMPELHSPLGYPLAIAAMALSAVLPYAFFKRKGWL